MEWVEKTSYVVIFTHYNLKSNLGGLVSDHATGKAILTEDSLAIGSIRREDVADLVVKALSSTNTERKILSAVDNTLESTANPDGRKADAFVLN